MKYLELIKGQFTADHEARAKQLEPYVAYSEEAGGVMYNFIPELLGGDSELTYNMVDLGLPSGTLWADRNVGATSPEDAGLYFQWGDTVGYTADQIEAGDKSFTWDSYFDTTDGGSTFNKYGIDKLTVLELSDDAAYVHMGSSYQTPTYEQIQELIDESNTTPTFIDLQGNEYTKSKAFSGAIASGNFKGVKFTASNGNSIFLPAAGYGIETVLQSMSTNGSYWSSNLRDGIDTGSHNLFFLNWGTLGENKHDRCYGRLVRGVQNPS